MPSSSPATKRPRRQRSHLTSARKSKLKPPGLFTRLLRFFRRIRFKKSTVRPSDKQQLPDIPDILISPPDDHPNSVVATTRGTLPHEREATLPASTKATISKTGSGNTDPREVTSRFITASSDDDFQIIEEQMDPAVTEPPHSAPAIEDERQLREQLESTRPDSIRINKRRIKALGEVSFNSVGIPFSQSRVFASCGNRQDAHEAPGWNRDYGAVQFQPIPEIIEAPPYPYRNNENSPA